MKQIEKWNQLFLIYKKTSRYQILKNKNKLKIFYFLLVIYMMISVTTYLLIDNYFYIALSIVISSAAIISYILSHVIQKTSLEDISNFPKRQREQLVRYQIFSSEYKANNILRNTDIDKLIQWSEIKSSKLQSINILLHPVIISIFGFLAKMIIPDEKLKEIPLSAAISISILFTIAVFFTWALKDIMIQSRHTEFEICRFLKWIKVNNSRA